MSNIIAIVSGGMDSVTLLYDILRQGHSVHVVSFNYGQRHSKELDSARYFAQKFNLLHSVIDLPFGGLLSGSSLTDDAVAVPDGHYAEESMRITVVPNRNAIMLSIAWGIAVAENAIGVATAVHAGDHYIYPDCRPEFITQLNQALRTATDGHRHKDLHIMAPYIDVDKTEIARVGIRLGVEYENTWTCYKGGVVHCGTCGSCTERQEALHLASKDYIDPTMYLTRTLPRVRNQ